MAIHAKGQPRPPEQRPLDHLQSNEETTFTLRLSLQESVMQLHKKGKAVLDPVNGRKDHPKIRSPLHCAGRPAPTL